MAQDWSELFLTGEPSDADTQAPQKRRERRGLFSRLRENLTKTRQALAGEIHATLFQSIDEHTWERLEEALIMADVGVATTAAVVQALEIEATDGSLKGPQEISERLVELLADAARCDQSQQIDLRHKPTVILMVGVNGTGKTTTIGKLAWRLREEFDLRVLLGAADTFRAAATEQLQGWAQRAGAEIVTGLEGSDPGSVAFEALERARREAIDVLIIDTAGRLHTQDDLMAELAKVRKVISRQLPDAPHETLLTLDASTGQNGLRQAKLFAQSAQVSGIVLSKLDGSARGGVALAVARETGIPVKLIGLGESVDDLRPFDASEFARALIAPAD